VFKVPGSNNWYIKYHMNGVPKRESTGTDNRRKAENVLRDRLNECAGGTLPENGRITVTELVSDFLARGRAKDDSAIEDSATRWRLHLQPKLGHLRASQLTTAMLTTYVQERKQEPIQWSGQKGKKKGRGVLRYPTVATTNRELSLLRAAYRLGTKCTPPKIIRVPYFPISREDNVRKGFLKDDEYLHLAEECGKIGLWLRGLFEVAASYAWRKSEATVNLRVSQIDLRNRTVDLNPGETKNRDGRTVKMTERVYQIIAACIEGKAPEDLVFTRLDGSAPGDFRKAWSVACDRAGCPGLLFHDLRRTGARNMRRLGIAENVIMRIGGWKTASVFRRYDIVDQTDLADASRRIEENQRQLEFGSSLGKVGPEKGANEITIMQ
jgi:integrase